MAATPTSSGSSAGTTSICPWSNRDVPAVSPRRRPMTSYRPSYERMGTPAPGTVTMSSGIGKALDGEAQRFEGLGHDFERRLFLADRAGRGDEPLEECERVFRVGVDARIDAFAEALGRPTIVIRSTEWAINRIVAARTSRTQVRISCRTVTSCAGAGEAGRCGSPMPEGWARGCPSPDNGSGGAEVEPSAAGVTEF